MAPQKKYTTQVSESESEPEQIVVEQVERPQYPPASKSKKYSKQPPPESESESEEEQEEAPAVRPRTSRPKAAPKASVRRKKYANEEEARSARLEQMRRWRQNRKERSVSVVLPDVETRNEFLKVLSFIKQKVEISSELSAVLSHLISQAAQN